MSRRKSAKELDIIEPGKILVAWRQLQDFITLHFRQVAAVGLIVLVVAAGIGLWQYQRVQAEQEAYGLFFAAMDRFNSNEKPAAGTDAQPAQGTHYQEALQQFKKIIEQYPQTTAGTTALFYAGACSYELKQDDDALGFYQEFLKKTSREQNYLRPAAYEGIGYVYERRGDYKQAREWFEKQKNEAGEALAIMALLNLARTHAALGEREKACACYKEFVDKYPSSSFAETARIGVSEFCSSPAAAPEQKPAP